MILVMDNYDSFVETLARYVREAGMPTRVLRNDAGTVDELLALRPTGVLLSPGPGRPQGAGICLEMIRAASQIPLLGVCLGHQALAEAYGGETVPAPTPMHGRASQIHHQGDLLFSGIASPFAAGRYHSLLGACGEDSPLEAIAWTDAGTLMGVRHRHFPHWGVQFHPESLLTPQGRVIIENFVAYCRAGGRE